MSKKSLTVNWYPFLSESKVIPSKSGNSCFSCVQRLIQLDTHLSGFCVLLCSFRKNMQSWSNWRHLSLWLYSPKKSWPILGWRLYQHLYRMMASSFDHWSSLPIWYFFFFLLCGAGRALALTATHHWVSISCSHVAHQFCRYGLGKPLYYFSNSTYAVFYCIWPLLHVIRTPNFNSTKRKKLPHLPEGNHEEMSKFNGVN